MLLVFSPFQNNTFIIFIHFFNKDSDHQAAVLQTFDFLDTGFCKIKIGGMFHFILTMVLFFLTQLWDNPVYVSCPHPSISAEEGFYNWAQIKLAW